MRHFIERFQIDGQGQRVEPFQQQIINVSTGLGCVDADGVVAGTEQRLIDQARAIGVLGVGKPLSQRVGAVELTPWSPKSPGTMIANRSRCRFFAR